MASTATARNAPARRASRSAPARRSPARPAPQRRRARHTPIGGFVPVAAGAVGGLADSGLVVRLTRGRMWIGLLGALLVGIVALNVMALSFSSSSSNAGTHSDELLRQNSALRTQIANSLSSEQVASEASRLGLIVPRAGAIRYLKTSPGDAAAAAKRLRDGAVVAGTGSTTYAVPETGYVAPVDPASVADPAAAPTAAEAAAPVIDPAASASAAPEEAASAAPTAAPTGVPAGDPAATGGGLAAP